MNTNYDVVVVGCGPIGITTACTIKALQPEVNICVVDKRADATRNHGLKINSSSVAKIQAVLTNSLDGYDSEEQKQNTNRLNGIFGGWSGQFVRTTKIEADLIEEATRMGITVLRGKDYGVTKENFDAFLEETPNDELPYELTTLQKIFKHAKIVIGADGAHSTTREVAMGGRLVDQETLRHLVELKYQTDGNVQPRGYFEASTASSVHGRLDFESMNKTSSEGRKPVTLHVFIDESTFDALRQTDESGNLKGVFGNSWTLEELRKEALTNKKIKALHEQFKTHLEGLHSRDGGCYDEKISTLKMEIYRSEECFKLYKGKYVLLVGDAESGIVLEGGFNKGLKGAAVCASAVSEFFKWGTPVSTDIPDEFVAYQEQIQQIFVEDKNWAKTKNKALTLAELAASGTNIMLDTSSTGCSLL